MAEQGEEQNKTEEASQFKLDRARKKGTVARSMDLGFLAMLVGIAAAARLFGESMIADIATMMRRSLTIGIAQAGNPYAVSATASQIAANMVWPVAVIGLFAGLFIVFVDIVQLRGIIFTTHPLKPDLSRLNPAKGLKRLFSLRMLKETGKNILKMAAYAGATFLLISTVLTEERLRAASGNQLPQLMIKVTADLLFVFIGLAVFFAVIDQIIVRKEFAKQMRMSRREVTREGRDREGEPRQKQKRKQLHAEYVKQSNAVANVAGSDVLIANPEHYAVALRYSAETMEAPEVRARGRNAFALRMRREARRLGIVIVENPVLARALYRTGRAGTAIPQDHYAAVADIYIMLRRQQQGREQG